MPLDAEHVDSVDTLDDWEVVGLVDNIRGLSPGQLGMVVGVPGGNTLVLDSAQVVAILVDNIPVGHLH